MNCSFWSLLNCSCTEKENKDDFSFKNSDLIDKLQKKNKKNEKITKEKEEIDIKIEIEKEKNTEKLNKSTPRCSAWTEEEDLLLKKYVVSNNGKNWKLIAENIPNRNPSQWFTFFWFFYSFNFF